MPKSQYGVWLDLQTKPAFLMSFYLTAMTTSDDPVPPLRAHTYLGKLCRQGHDHQGTGQSLRYLSGGGCIECHRSQDEARRAPAKAEVARRRAIMAESKQKELAQLADEAAAQELAERDRRRQERELNKPRRLEQKRLRQAEARTLATERRVLMDELKRSQRQQHQPEIANSEETKALEPDDPAVEGYRLLLIGLAFSKPAP